MEGQRNPFEHSICLSVSLHNFGVTRKVSPELVETDADRKLLRVSKTIYASNSMEQIKELYGGIRSHLQTYTIVGAMFRSGIYVTPYDHVTIVEEYLKQKMEALEFWKYQLSEEYEIIQGQFQEKLGSLYRDSDYPSVDQMNGKIFIEYQWLALDVPGALRYINNGIWQSEQEKARARVQVIAENIEQIMTASLQELVDHLVERLTDTDDGKRKKFATNMVDKAREFFTTFRAKNLTGAESLNDLAEQGLSILDGVNLDQLKDQTALREHVRDQFKAIQSNMSAMITVAPRRALRLHDEVPATPSESTYEGQTRGEIVRQVFDEHGLNTGFEAVGVPNAGERAAEMVEAITPSTPAVSMTGTQLVNHMVDDVLGPEPQFYPDEEPSLF
jgi:hypothetical protein